MANPKPTKTGKETGAKSFTKDNQPSGEAKSAGWDRRRQAQKIMKEMIKYQDMTSEEFQKYLEKNKSTLKLSDIITATRTKEILKDKNMMKYWIDKHIPNAPTQQEISGIDGNPLSIDLTTADTDTLLKLLGR